MGRGLVKTVRTQFDRSYGTVEFGRASLHHVPLPLPGLHIWGAIGGWGASAALRRSVPQTKPQKKPRPQKTQPKKQRQSLVLRLGRRGTTTTLSRLWSYRSLKGAVFVVFIVRQVECGEEVAIVDRGTDLFLVRSEDAFDLAKQF